MELVQTLDDCDMSEYIPTSASSGLREILLGCLNHIPRECVSTITIAADSNNQTQPLMRMPI